MDQIRGAFFLHARSPFPASSYPFVPPLIGLSKRSKIPSLWKTKIRNTKRDYSGQVYTTVLLCMVHYHKVRSLLPISPLLFSVTRSRSCGHALPLASTHQSPPHLAMLLRPWLRPVSIYTFSEAYPFPFFALILDYLCHLPLSLLELGSHLPPCAESDQPQALCCFLPQVP